MRSHGRSPEELPLSRTFIVLAAVAAIACGCHGSSNPDGGSGNGPGERCTAHADCASGLCVLSDNTPIGFCSEPCKAQGDCGADFPGGCCLPTTQGDQVCAIAALCTHGDAGLGDPCPTGEECVAGLYCLSDGVISECSHPCGTTSDCEGVSQECCENIAAAGQSPALFCVLDPTCGGTGDAGPGYDAGPIGPTGDDGGPFYAALIVDGTLTADTTSYEGYVGQGTDTLKAPPTSRSIELDLGWDLPVGSYGCATDAGIPDGGLFAVVNTGTSQPSPGFVDLLPSDWQNLTLNFACGPGSVYGGTGDLQVLDAQIDVQSFTPGRLRSPDAGPQKGHVKGTAYWLVGSPDAGGGLEVRERFDVDLAAP